MSLLSSLVASLAAQDVKTRLARARNHAAAYVVAALLAGASAIFFLAAAAIWLSEWLGAAGAALLTGAILALAAGGIIIAVSINKRRAKRRAMQNPSVGTLAMAAGLASLGSKAAKPGPALFGLAAAAAIFLLLRGGGGKDGDEDQDA